LAQRGQYRCFRVMVPPTFLDDAEDPGGVSRPLFGCRSTPAPLRNPPLGVRKNGDPLVAERKRWPMSGSLAACVDSNGTLSSVRRFSWAPASSLARESARPGNSQRQGDNGTQARARYGPFGFTQPKTFMPRPSDSGLTPPCYSGIFAQRQRYPGRTCHLEPGQMLMRVKVCPWVFISGPEPQLACSALNDGEPNSSLPSRC